MSPNESLTTVLPEGWSWLEEMIDSGVEPLSTVMLFAVDIALESNIDVLSARRGIQERWDRRIAAENSWDGPTDGDKVEAVFDSLERQGIATAMGFSVSPCAMTNHLIGSGSYLSGEARWCYLSVPGVDDDLPEGSVEILTNCADGCTNPVLDPEANCTCVARAVLQALDAVGLTNEWDGHVFSPVVVSGLDWKKRLPR